MASLFASLLFFCQEFFKIIIHRFSSSFANSQNIWVVVSFFIFPCGVCSNHLVLARSKSISCAYCSMKNYTSSIMLPQAVLLLCKYFTLETKANAFLSCSTQSTEEGKTLLHIVSACFCVAIYFPLIPFFSVSVFSQFKVSWPLSESIFFICCECNGLFKKFFFLVSGTFSSFQLLEIFLFPQHVVIVLCCFLYTSSSCLFPSLRNLQR